MYSRTRLESSKSLFVRKVLHLCATLDVGGAERMLRSYAAESAHEVVVVTLDSSSVDCVGGFEIKRFNLLRSRLEIFGDFGVLFVDGARHSSRLAHYGIVLAGLVGFPTGTVVVNEYIMLWGIWPMSVVEFDSVFGLRRWSHLSLESGEFITYQGSECSSMKLRAGLGPSLWIPNFLDSRPWPTLPAELRETIVVGGVGRFHAVKDFYLLLSVFASFRVAERNSLGSACWTQLDNTNRVLCKWIDDLGLAHSVELRGCKRHARLVCRN